MPLSKKLLEKKSTKELQKLKKEYEDKLRTINKKIDNNSKELNEIANIETTLIKLPVLKNYVELNKKANIKTYKEQETQLNSTTKLYKFNIKYKLYEIQVEIVTILLSKDTEHDVVKSIKVENVNSSCPEELMNCFKTSSYRGSNLNPFLSNYLKMYDELNEKRSKCLKNLKYINIEKTSDGINLKYEKNDILIFDCSWKINPMLDRPSELKHVCDFIVDLKKFPQLNHIFNKLVVENNIANWIELDQKIGQLKF